MEDPEEEDWEYEEYNYNSSKQDLKESNFSWFFRKGLSIGKKAVITGVLISSAPLILPSLVVVSALGFAVSVPAGVVLASYTCTEKLMNKLLPLPAFSYTILEEEGDEIGQFEVARKDQGVFSIGKYNQMNNRELDSKDNAKAENSPQDDEKESPKSLVSKAAECKPENAGRVQVLDIKKVNDNDVSRDKSKGKRNKKKSKSCLKISQRIGERESKKETVNWDAKSNVQNLVPVVEMKSSLSQNTGNGILDKRRDESTVGLLKDSEEALYNVANEDSGAYKVKAKIPANGVLAANEKILWDKVDALRLIVGYKAARKPSLREELRALYVFTGIEPTSSFENSNSGDVQRSEEEKLRFLMYIIGVK